MRMSITVSVWGRYTDLETVEISKQRLSELGVETSTVKDKKL